MSPIKFDVSVVYNALRQKGSTPEAQLGWEGDTQQRNFQLLVDTFEELGLPPSGLSLHDAGCGHGDLLAFLRERQLAPALYIGTDFNPDALTTASKLQSLNAIFQRADMTKAVPSADITVALGSLAFHAPRVIERILHNLWARTNVALCFTTWWQLSDEFISHADTPQLQKCINRFVREARPSVQVQKAGESYGVPTERFFVLLK